jgi:ribosome-associated protein
MIEHNIKLKKDQAYIQLNKVLQIIGVAQTGGHAKILIQNNEVLVNGVIETRVRNKLIKNDLVTVGDVLIKIE